MMAGYFIKPIKAMILTAVMLILTSAVMAAEDYFVDAMVNTHAVRIGESFKLVVTAGARQGLVRLPGEHIAIHGSHLLEYKEKDVSRRHEGFIARQGIYHLKAFVLDRIYIPPLPVLLEWNEGNSITAFTTPVNITIKSMNPEKGFNLINPRLPLPLPLPWLMLTALAIMLIISLTLLILFKPKKRAEQPVQPAHTTALNALNMLGSSKTVADKNSEEYFVTLSKLIRRYLSERYRLPALELSRTAIIYALEQRGIEAKRRDLIDQLLKETDMVKFAMQPATEKQMAEAHGMAREIIEMTKETAVKSKKDKP